MPMPKGTVLQSSDGRIVGVRDLTEKQQKFLRVYIANGARPILAARDAGYADPDSAAAYLLKQPHIQAALHAERNREISDLATIGLGRVRTILEKSENEKVVLDATKFVVGLAGHVAPKAVDATDVSEKAVEDMNRDELEAFIRRGKAMLAAQAAAVAVAESVQVQPIIDVLPDAPNDAQEDGQGDGQVIDA
jgi:hypothetical protein